jgi:hypothetical protein
MGIIRYSYNVYNKNSGVFLKLEIFGDGGLAITTNF